MIGLSFVQFVCGDPVSHEDYDYSTVKSVSSVGSLRTAVTSQVYQLK